MTPVRFYMDVHVHGLATLELRRRGVDVLTAQEDGWRRRSDPELLDRATALDRVFVTYDEDLLVESTRRQRQGIQFAGIVYTVPTRITLGDLIEQLHFIALVADMDYMRNRLERLPLW